MNGEVNAVNVNKVDEPLEVLKNFYSEMNVFSKKITYWGNIGKDSAEDKLFDEWSEIFSRYLTLRENYTQHEVCLSCDFEYDFSKINVSWHKVNTIKAIMEIRETSELARKVKYSLLKTDGGWKTDVCQVFDELKRYWIRTII